MMWEIRPFAPQDAPAAARLFGQAVQQGEVIYAPEDARAMRARAAAEGYCGFAAHAGQKLIGFVHASARPGDTPLYIGPMAVATAWRGQGVGTSLLQALCAMAAAQGRPCAEVSGHSPAPVSWRVPHTAGHDHNNAPGVQEGSAGCAFLRRAGFVTMGHELGMHLDLQGYRPDGELEARLRALEARGIRAGVWQPGMSTRCDEMCDRVGSEYWRHVLHSELEAWRTGRPNDDAALWPDGRRPAGPRPLIVAQKDGRLIGFTGPVDVQRSGRGWFTGICTDPREAGQGVGTALFGLLLAQFCKAGARFSTLYTGEENPARRLYERAGFQTAARFAVMRKDL